MKKRVNVGDDTTLISEKTLVSNTSLSLEKEENEEIEEIKDELFKMKNKEKEIFRETNRLKR